MTRGNYRKDGIDNRGYGSQGFCKLCSFKDAKFQLSYDERTRAKWSPNQINEWSKGQGQPGAVASKETIYNHRKHVMHPQDKVVTAVQRSEQRALQTKPQADPDTFLQAVVSTGMQRAIDNPEEITIDHALRAAQALNQSSGSAKGGIAVLIGLVTGKSNVTAHVIDGQAVEVS